MKLSLIVRCSFVIKKLYSLVSVNVKFLANLREEVKKGQHAVKNVTWYPICCWRKTSICSMFNEIMKRRSEKETLIISTIPK